MAQAHRLPRDSRGLRQLVRRAREDRGLLPRQLAASAGVHPSDAEFVEAHGVAVTASMLAVLDALGIEDYHSQQMAKLAQLIPGGRGEAVLRQLAESGLKTVEEIEASANSDLLDLPGFDLGQLGLLREGLRLYRTAESLDDADES